MLGLWPLPVVSFVAALAASWLCIKVAKQLGIVDRPDGLVKTHTEPIAYLGGIGIFAGFSVGLLAGVVYLPGESGLLLGVLAGGAIACAVGAVDDIRDIRPWQKILGQVAAAGVFALAGVRPVLNYFAEPLGWAIHPAIDVGLGFVITIVFVLGATNSLNLLDGIDGLCSGVTAVIALGMAVLGVLAKQENPDDFVGVVRIILALILLGSAGGFWLLNKHPAKIFMGDAGSLFFGSVIAVLMMLFARAGPKWCLASIVIFGLPILDTAVAFVRRWINKRPVFVPDRGHIYDQMMDRGISLKKTVAICCGLGGVYAAAGIVISQLRTSYALIVCAVVVVISAAMVWKRGFLKMEGLRGAIQKENESQ